MSMRFPIQATGEQLVTWLQNVTKYFQKSCSDSDKNPALSCSDKLAATKNAG